MTSLAFDHHGPIHTRTRHNTSAWRDPLDKTEWITRPLTQRDAITFIEEHHYAGGASITSVARVGLYHRHGSELLGVAIYLPPPGRAATRVHAAPNSVLALSRLAIHPTAPKNAASFLISRSLHALPDRYQHVLTYADEARRHTGIIYQATNWAYLGLTRPAPTYADPDGRHVSRKRGPTTLTHAQMLERGYRLIGRYARHAYHYDRARPHPHPRAARAYPTPAPTLFTFTT